MTGILFGHQWPKTNSIAIGHDTQMCMTIHHYNAVKHKSRMSGVDPRLGEVIILDYYRKRSASFLLHICTPKSNGIASDNIRSPFFIASAISFLANFKTTI